MPVVPSWYITTISLPRNVTTAAFMEALYSFRPETRALLGPSGLSVGKGEWPTHEEDIAAAVKKIGAHCHITLLCGKQTGNYHDDWEKDFLLDYKNNGKVKVSHYRFVLERSEIPQNRKKL